MGLDASRMLRGRLRAAIESMTVETDAGVKLSITISVGIAALEGDITPGQLVARADLALYASKNAGRNCVTLFETENLILIGAGMIGRAAMRPAVPEHRQSSPQ